MLRLSYKQRRDYSVEEVDQLVTALRSGVNDNIPTLIDAHLDMVGNLCGRFIGSNPHQRDDIICTAYTALAEAVNRAGGVLVDNQIGKYINSFVRGRIMDFLASDHLIAIPKAEYKRRVEKEDPRAFVQRTMSNCGTGDTVLNEEMHASGVLENIAIIVPLDTLTGTLNIPVWDEVPQTMEDLYERMHLTEREIVIINHRLDGLTLEEIGLILGVSKVAIHLSIEKIKSKLPELHLKMPKEAPLISGTKVCSACHEEKSLSLFYKIGEDKYKSICKGCMKGAREAKTIGIC